MGRVEEIVCDRCEVRDETSNSGRWLTRLEVSVRNHNFCGDRSEPVHFRGDLCPDCKKKLLADIDLAGAVSKLKREK